MTRKWIAEEWETFKLIIPPGASEIQVNEMRKSFFAGAGALFSLVTNVSSGDEVSEGDLQKMTDIEHELREFLNEIRAAAGGTKVRMGSA